MRRIALIICLICTSCIVNAQNWILKNKVAETKQKGTGFTPVQALSYERTIHSNASAYQILHIDTIQLNDLFNAKPQALTITIPLNENETQTFELIRTDLGNVNFTKNGGQKEYNVYVPLCYRGVANGVTEKNNAMLTISPGYFSFTAVSASHVISIPTFSATNKQELKLFDSKTFSFDPADPIADCGTHAVPTPDALKAIQLGGDQNKTSASQDKCVYAFVECFDSLYAELDSSYQATVNYVYALFNNVATGYLNEQINIKISAINVWTSDDPYSGNTREEALADLAAYYQNNFWGNICVGLDYGTNGRSGLAGSIGLAKHISPNVCQVYTVANNPFLYADMNYGYNVQNFPTGPNVTQQQVYLTMHEIGHLLGSAHTQWCGWVLNTNPLVTGALDNCTAVEGSCSPGPAPGPFGGTIMSYCGGSGDPGISYNNGFGNLPGAAIRNFVSNQNCISNCVSCPANLSIGGLAPGAQVFEVSNTLTATGTSSAFAYATLDAGVKVVLSPGFHAVNGSRMNIIINGCGGIR